MNKQFNSNQELNNFACNYIRDNYDLSKSYFASQFGIINDPLDWFGSWEEYSRIIINAGYDVENLRSGLCDEFLEAYDKLKNERMIKKYYLDMVITISNTDVLESDPDIDCIVYEIDPQKPEELKSINDRIERWNGYTFNHGHVTVTTCISEISAEEAKNYTIMKAADYFPELAQN